MANSPIGSPRLMREVNLLRMIYDAGPITRSEIGALTGLNHATVARLVAALLEKNLLDAEAMGSDRGKRGRPSDLLRINAGAGYALGLEFGEDHLILALTDALGSVCFWKAFDEAPAFVMNDETMDQLGGLARHAVEERGVDWDAVRACGLALHGLVNAEGDVLSHEPSDDEPYQAQDYLRRALSRAVTVEDVSRAFAVAEHRFGAGKGAQEMIYVFLGSHGVGGGIFANNRMLRTSTGVCGEIGHLVIDEQGSLCQCGSRGCLETVASQQAVIQQFQALKQQGVATSLAGVEAPSFAQICQAAAEGDKSAYLVLNGLANNLGKALGSVINISGAPVVVIGGRLSMAGDTFLNDVSSVLRQRVIASLAKHISVRYAQLPHYSGAWGVAVQALEEAWSNGTFLVEEV